jgi:pimeloyl-ACP methyl ester carboxylesterase
VRADEGDYVSSYDGTRIHYLDEGEGICLVPCNGVLCSTGYWAYFRNFFRNRCRVVVWDYRGHGRSELPTNLSRISIASYCHDLKSVLDRLGVHRAVLLGHSMGVQVILEFYRSHPERVAALIPICGTYAHASRTFYGMEWLGRAVPPVLRAAEKHAATLARVLKPLLRSRIPDPFARLTGAINWYLCPREIMKDYFRHLATLDFRVAARALQAMEDHDAEDVLGTIRVPTLVIAGEQDRMTPLWVMERMWQSIPGADFLVIPKGTHTALVENPLLMNLRIELFLRDHFIAKGDPYSRVSGIPAQAPAAERQRNPSASRRMSTTTKRTDGGSSRGGARPRGKKAAGEGGP